MHDGEGATRVRAVRYESATRWTARQAGVWITAVKAGTETGAHYGKSRTGSYEREQAPWKALQLARRFGRVPRALP